jgi:hypothetical protein
MSDDNRLVGRVRHIGSGFSNCSQKVPKCLPLENSRQLKVDRAEECRRSLGDRIEALKSARLSAECARIEAVTLNTPPADPPAEQ